MRRYTLLVLFLLVTLSLASCVPSMASIQFATPIQSTTYEATPLKGDPRVVFNVLTKMLVIDVTSPTGIGSTQIEKTSGHWPSYLVVRLRLTGLESFKFRYADSLIAVTVSSQGDYAVSETYQQAGQTSTINAGDPEWITVTLGEGYFDLQAPVDFLKSGENTFTIEWINFYR